MRFVKLLSAFAAFVGITSSCSIFSGSDKDLRPVARVFDQYLYAEDLAAVVPSGTSAADSTLIAQNFIDNWVKQQVILAQAEQNLSDEQKNFEQQVQNYRNSLLIYAFEKNLVEQKLDTSFTEEELKAYYDSNGTSLKLNDYLYKLYYIKVDAGKQINGKMQKLLRSGSDNDLEELKNLCTANAIDYSFNDQIWVTGAELANKIPLSSANKSNIANREKLTTINTNGSEYYIFTLRSYSPGDIPPLEVVTTDIKERLLNTRKVKLIEQMRTDLVNVALNKANAETF